MVVSLFGGVGVESRFVFVGCWVSFVCFRVKNLSGVGWNSLVESDGVLCGIVHRGGECHVDARWRLSRRAAFNGSGGWF